MTTDLWRKICDMAAPAKPSQQELADVLQGWTDYFSRYDIPQRREELEFDQIMRARLQSGVISILAPEQKSLR